MNIDFIPILKIQRTYSVMLTMPSMNLGFNIFIHCSVFENWHLLDLYPKKWKY